jgi:hypothetical protein
MFWTKLSWSVHTLRPKVNGMLFERTALSKNSEEVARQDSEHFATRAYVLPIHSVLTEGRDDRQEQSAAVFRVFDELSAA